MKQFVQRIAVGLEFSRGVFHGHILHAEQDHRFPLAIGQFLVDDPAHADEHIRAFGGGLWSRMGIGEQAWGRRGILVFSEFVQR